MLGVVVVVAGAGAAAGWIAGKESRSATGSAVPEWVDEFNSSLTSYLETVQGGAGDAEVIDSLIGSLDALKSEAEEGKLPVEAAMEQWDGLIRVVADYTSKLARANSVDLSDLERLESESEAGRVIDLRRYLEAQWQILEKSA